MQSQKRQNDLCSFPRQRFCITVIQVYAPTSNTEEAEVEWFYEDLQDLLELTPQKDVLFIIGDWNAKGHLFWMLVLKGLVGLHRTFQLQLLQHYWLGIDLDYHDIERFASEMNRDHSVVFETASKYCILDSFVDHDGYSISSEGFLPTLVDIMVI